MEPRRQRSIVIVEDDLDLIATLSQAFSQRGLLVHAFTEATPALDHLCTHPPPDVLLLDYLLPEMNGAQFARALSRQGVIVPIVLLTGADRVCSDALHHVPAAMVIKKPFDLDDLFHKLDVVLDAA
jgi:CheY-like chemotaxis protein